MSDTRHQPGWLLLGGCPRSGTTLLNLLLNSHPEIRISNEHNLWHLIEQARGLFESERKLQQVPDRRKGNNERWSRDMILAATLRFDRSIRPLFETLYQTSLVDEGTGDSIGWFGDKLPRYYRHDLAELRAVLGEVRVIHLVRHPVDVINSMLWRAANARVGDDYWRGPGDIETAGNEWVSAWNHMTALAAENTTPLLLLSYDELVSRSEEVSAAIAGFLGVSAAFDRDLIVRDARSDRSALDGDQIAAIEQRFEPITSNWGMPLRELAQRVPQLPLLEQAPARKAVQAGSTAGLARLRRLFRPER